MRQGGRRRLDDSGNDSGDIDNEEWDFPYL